MARMDKARSQGARGTGEKREWSDLPGDIGFLLTEIEKEPVPQRLLQLAEELQRALIEHRTGRKAKPSKEASSG